MASTSGRDSLADRTNSHALATVTARFTIHLHPSKTQDVLEGVREQLNMRLLQYSEDLDGVLLSYSDAHITDSVARLHPYFPFLAVTVVAKITLFCPRQGHHLVGRVIKVGQDYIGLLVLGVFNAAIGADHIRKEFKCSTEAGTWVSLRHHHHRIQVGSYVRFLVDSILDHASLFSIVGSLREADTGVEEFCKTSSRAAAAAAGGDGASSKASKAKKGKAEAGEQGQQQDGQADKQQHNKEQPKQKHKKHKQEGAGQQPQENGKAKQGKKRKQGDGADAAAADKKRHKGSA